jgi:uncharacterized protein
VFIWDKTFSDPELCRNHVDWTQTIILINLNKQSKNMGKFQKIKNVFLKIRSFVQKEKILSGMWLFVLVFGMCSSLVQSNFGSIDVKVISIVEEEGMQVSGKLYRPNTATATNPLPGVLLCHGMNNDKDTEAPLALEFAKNGFVVLCVDQINHGDSDPGGNMIQSLLGSGEASDGPDVSNTIGANAMYNYLKNCAFVDSSQMGMAGHSMGGTTVRELALLNPDHRAIVIQAGGPDNLSVVTGMNNYLDVWPKYEELFITSLETRDDFVSRGQEMIKYNVGLIGESSKGEGYDQTYGDFTLGTAQRYALCECTHPGATWNSKSIQETVAWMLQALKGTEDQQAALQLAKSQTYLVKEIFSLLSLLTLLFSVIPFTDMLLKTSKFAGLKGSPSKNIPLSEKEWWKTASKNSAIGGISFIFLPGIGMVLGGALAFVFPVFRLLTGNGSLFWLLINAWIGKKLFDKWRYEPQDKKENSKDSEESKEELPLIIKKNLEHITNTDLGLFEDNEENEKKTYLRTCLLLVFYIFVYMYCTVSLIQSYIGIELRFMWPVLKQFTPLRFFLFLVYLVPVYYFFKVNAGYLMLGQARLKEEATPAKTQLIWWLKYLFMMEFGLFIIFLIQYLPMFLFDGPPAFSYSIFTFLFGLFGIFLMQVLPQFAVVFFIMIAQFRRTGKIYLSSITGTVITAWIMAVSGMLI